MLASSQLSPPVPDTSLFGDKLDNYKFLKLVQQQKYEQAYQLGIKILKQNPGAASVRKFCMFIEENQPELKKMVQEEKEEAEYTSDQEEEEQNDEDQDDSEEDSEEKSEEESSSSEEEEEEEGEKEIEKQKEEIVVVEEKEKQPEEEKKPKKEKTKCEPHEWTHVCKNPNCPNKKKS